MQLRIEVTESELKQLVLAHLQEKLGNISFKAENVRIEVKSKQNYKSEWEVAAYRAVYETVSA
jgi:hypothetical protein